MAAVKRLLKEMETRTFVWLARSRMSSLMIVGTLAAAGLGAAALGGQSSTPGTLGQALITPSTQPISAYGCNNDPDGDGHIFCDGSVAIAQLPASFGHCHADPYVGLRIVCRGTGD
jgi:hypothetical protein